MSRTLHFGYLNICPKCRLPGRVTGQRSKKGLRLQIDHYLDKTHRKLTHVHNLRFEYSLQELIEDYGLRKKSL